MGHLNVEFKARCENPDAIEHKLKNLGADYKGEDHQIDSYFNVPKGRLKLREGNIENSLIYYVRKNITGAKDSDVVLHKPKNMTELKDSLIEKYGIKVVVDKKRKIYFIDNVKFHVDEVKDLGRFLEVEAIDLERTIGRQKLLEQCEKYKREFGVREEDLISCSYSDLLLEKKI